VGSIVAETDINRVMRLLRMLRHTVKQRNQALAAAGVPDVSALPEPPRRVHVLIDNLPALVEALEAGPIRLSHLDMLSTVLADGRRVGIHVTATTARRAGVPAGMQAAFGERLVLRMTTDDDYVMLGVPGRVVTPDSPPGRGLMGRHEFQVATVAGRAQRLAGRLGDPTTYLSAPVPAMPTRVPFTLLPRPTRDRMAIAVDAEFVDAVTVGLLDAPMVVAGRSRAGRSSMLAGLAALARRSDQPPAEVILAGPRAERARGEYDTRLATPEDVLAWSPAGGEGWRLLLVDDAHLWEREWEAGGVTREAVAVLASIVDNAAAHGLAVVVATDVDEARSRQHVPGVVSAARRGRRGVLLAPDFADGSLFSVMVPTAAVEPLGGPGRGVYCVDASMQVVQVVGLPEGVGHGAVHS
jgi:S-DNA-T family DNA segregation ATPase FtsK/SpoIIIE